jgi:adenylyltransferase/sulfurtransferase
LYPQSRTTQGASLLLVGIGALGCAAAAVLARARLGRLTLVDPDRVEASNLQRQLLFAPRDAGRLKAVVAAEALRSAATEVTAVAERLDAGNAAALIGAHDFVIDACDDPATKFLINEVAVRCGVAFSYGGVVRTSGLAMTVVPGATACLACVFRADQGDAPQGCQDQGILAPVAGVIGCLQAAHAFAVLDRSAAPIAGRLFSYELRSRRWRVLAARRDAHCSVCGATRATEPRRNDACHS